METTQVQEAVHLKTRRATLQADGTRDVGAVTLIQGTAASFSLNFNDGKEPRTLHMPVDQLPQGVEALQFVTDALGEEIQGRLSPFVRGWISLSQDVHHLAKSNGFWEDGVERNNGEMLALVHSEISEALEALRKDPDAPDEKVPDFNKVETELADAVIRIMDLAAARGWRVAQAMEAKHAFNKTRPYKHGKKF